MAQGSKAKYTSKQKRMAKHIEDSEGKKRGKKVAERIAWATVNKETGGAGKRVKSKAASTTKRRSSGRSKTTHASA